MIDLAMIAPSKETASKGHLHDLLIHRSFFQHNQCQKKKFKIDNDTNLQWNYSRTRPWLSTKIIPLWWLTSNSNKIK